MTVRTQYATFSEAFVPGWDDKTGAEQKMDRVAERIRLGHKMTPIGRGTLRPAR